MALTYESIFDRAAAGWKADFDNTVKAGYTVIKISLPDGWADGDLYLVCVPFDTINWYQPVTDMQVTVKTSELGSRGYVYAASVKDGHQKSAPIITYRIKDGEVIALGR